MSAFTDPQLRALRALRDAYPNATIAIIGAAALATHMPMTWRHTADLDLVLTIAFADLDAGLAKLSGWENNPHQSQRWITPDGAKIDLVPAPQDALAARELTWPTTGATMSLVGIRLALEESPTEIGPDLSVRIASIPVIVLLKIAAYLDRPERVKDLQDIAWILNDYPPPNDDRLYSNEIIAAGIANFEARGRIMGEELNGLLNQEERAIVEQFLSDLEAEGSTWDKFVTRSNHDEDEVRKTIAAFRAGFVTKKPVKSSVVLASQISFPLIFVVNGEETKVEVSPREPLSKAVEQALTQSKNTGRPLADWELRDKDGKRISDLTRSAEDHKLAPSTVLFLTLKVGAGGHVS